MPFTSTPRRGKTYYLHTGPKRGGGIQHDVSTDPKGPIADALPEGFELYEPPNGQVYLRKKEPARIQPAELYTQREPNGPGALAMEREVARYLATGQSDPLGRAFPGRHALECITGYEHRLRKALINEVRRREDGCQHQQVPRAFNSAAWVRRKVEPMITGLFPKAERAVVLGVAERSIIFLTREATHRIIREIPSLESAWTIANMYLDSLRVHMLGDGARPIVGLSEEIKCYVSLEYFVEKDSFADCVVHEVAHIFHNCKRATIGLPPHRSKEWLLDIAFTERETFAYACEAYSRILEQSHGRADRNLLVARYARGSMPTNDQVERTELMEILAEAVEARNGWKRILARCSRRNPTPKPEMT